jgi:hypothetical protein
MDLCPPIWERQKGERTKAFYLFTLYRDMGPLRSLDKLSQELTESEPNSIGLQQLKNYSTRCEWVKRAEGYDIYLEEIQRKQREADILEMNERHAKEYKEQQEQVKASMNGETDPYKINIATLAYDRAAKGERLSIGVATERKETEHSGSIDSNQTHKVLFKDKLQADILEDEGYGGSET